MHTGWALDISISGEHKWSVQTDSLHRYEGTKRKSGVLRVLRLFIVGGKLHGTVSGVYMLSYQHLRAPRKRVLTLRLR